jgi:hypothetical protein
VPILKDFSDDSKLGPYFEIKASSSAYKPKSVVLGEFSDTVIME